PRGTLDRIDRRPRAFCRAGQSPGQGSLANNTVLTLIPNHFDRSLNFPDRQIDYIIVCRLGEAIMPFAIIFGVLDVVFIVHAAKTGRLNPWAYVIILLPGVGAFAYVLFELLPEWLHGAHGQRAKKRVINTLDPEREYRKMSDDLAITDTIAN